MNKMANVSALGYAAFALTLWMNSMIPAGWFDPSDSMLAMLLAIVLGGCVMAVAGILQYLRGHGLDAILFLGFAAFWWVTALASHMQQAGGSAPSSQGFLGWYYLVWALLAFGIWLASWRDGVARMLFALGVCASLLAFALAEWTRINAVTALGGYLGLVTAIIGFYIAAAEIINEVHGHIVLPLGESPSNDRPPSSP